MVEREHGWWDNYGLPKRDPGLDVAERAVGVSNECLARLTEASEDHDDTLGMLRGLLNTYEALNKDLIDMLCKLELCYQQSGDLGVRSIGLALQQILHNDSQRFTAAKTKAGWGKKDDEDA